MFIAKKLCKFAGRSFSIGEEIPDGYILPMAVTRLKTIGLIAETEAGSLLPASGSSEIKEEKTDLMKLKRAELVEMAEGLGMVVTDQTKKELIAFIEEVRA